MPHLRFRKKPVVIEAILFTGDNYSEVLKWCASMEPEHAISANKNGITIDTLEGDMLALPGDWIIRGIKGELYPCKPDIFAATYEPVEEQVLRDADDLTM